MIGMVGVVRVITAPTPIRIPIISPVKSAVRPVRRPSRIPEWVPSVVEIRPEAETSSQLERDGRVWLVFDHINGVNDPLDAVNRGVFLVNFLRSTLYGVGIEITVIGCHKCVLILRFLVVWRIVSVINYDVTA